MPRLCCLLFLALIASACAKEEQAEPARLAVEMLLRADADLATNFFAQPFPFEARRLDDGTYDLAGFPNPVSYALIEFYKRELAKGIDGYGTTSALYLGFSGALTFEGAVTEAAASARGEASVLLVNIDEDSPDYLSFTPVWTRFFRGESKFLPVNTLAIVPMPGFPLRPNTLYAAVVTVEHGLRGLEGPLRQAESLRAALGGSGPFGETFAPLKTAIAEIGLKQEKIVGATVYRTMDFAAPLFAARDWLHAEGVTGSARVTAEYTQFGATARHLHGMFESVQFQHGGKPPFAEVGTGGFRLNGDGVPIPAGTSELRFALQLPYGDPPAGGWPLVIYAHGTGGDYHSAMGTSAGDEGYQLAQQGIALVGYDQPYHGTRNARVDPCTSDCPMLYTFNFLNPAAARDGFRQSALDAVQLMRAMLAAEFNAFGKLHTFDPERIYYMGHSQGSTSGPMFVAAEDLVKAAVFSGPAGGLTLTFLYKTEPVDIPGIVGFLFGDQEGFDIFHPVTNLFQAYMEPIDPMNYGPLMARAPRKPELVRDILATEGLTDDFTPAIQAEAFAIASGLQPVAPFFQDLTGGFDIAGLLPKSPDFEGNLTNVNGKRWTGGLLQFPDNGHYAIYCQKAASESYADFLGSKAYGSRDNAVIADYGGRGWKLGDKLGDNDTSCTKSKATAAPMAP